MAKAAYVLARHFGWTPDILQKMTMAQINFYMEMLREERTTLEEQPLH
ncbi:MAG: hypothetical protein AAFP19_24640 [Bacteroidota bacterium]